MPMDSAVNGSSKQIRCKQKEIPQMKIINITPAMEKEYLAGTLPGFLSCNPNFGMAHLIEVTVWPVEGGAL